MFEIHDRHQLELRNLLPLHEGSEPCRLEVETYFFIPTSVGLNASNYDRATFYGDTTALMRLDAPPLPLESLADIESSRSPLKPVFDALIGFRVRGRVPSSLRLAVHVKLFAHVWSRAVIVEISRLEGLLEVSRRRELEGRTAHFIDHVQRSLASYRRLRAGLWPFEPLCHGNFIAALASADEYMSLFLEERLAHLAERIDAEPKQFDGTGFAAQFKERLTRVAADEARHRLKYGFLVHTAERKDLKEYFTYRRSLLKKSIQQALYLDARGLPTDAFVRNSVGAFGAALAAVWAWATQLPATVAGLSTNAKLLLFLGAVAAYIAKDRIKATTNEYLVPKLRKYDKRSRIRGAALEEVGLATLSAELSERMQLISYAEIDPKIVELRLQGRSGRFLSDAAKESVLRYSKILTVEPSVTASLPEGHGILDIFRFNVRHFLSRLDDPNENIAYFDVEYDQFNRAKLPKVYHVNVVVRVKANGSEERHHHFRLILNKKGIVRTEEIAIGRTQGNDDGAVNAR